MTGTVSDLREAANRRVKETIRTLQGMARISNVEMARRTGINRTTYASRIDLTDPTEPSAVEIELIAAALGVSIGTIYLPVEQAVQQALREGFLDPDERGHATSGDVTSSYGQNGADLDIRAA